MPQDLHNLFIFFGGALSLLQSLVHVTRREREKADLFLFIVDVCIGIILLQQYYLLSRASLGPDLSLRPVTGAKFIVGPAAYIFYMLVFDTGFRISARTMVHFIPAMFSGLFSAMIFLEPLAGNVLLTTSVHALQTSRFLEFFHFSSLLIILGYVTVLFTRFRLYSVVTKRISGPDYRHAFILMTVFMTVLTLLVAGIVLRTVSLVNTGFALLSFLVMYRFLALQRHPGLLRDVSRAVRKSRYERSIMKGIDTDSLQERLRELMDEDKIYCDEDLTLARLARLLSLSTHQLSEFLNNHLKENFNSYVNRYRVEEAKRLMEEYPGRPLLSIAFGVGFNTRSVFYEAFTKYAGMSPARYRKNIVNHGEKR